MSLLRIRLTGNLVSDLLGSLRGILRSDLGAMPYVFANSLSALDCLIRGGLRATGGLVVGLLCSG